MHRAAPIQPTRLLAAALLAVAADAAAAQGLGDALRDQVQGRLRLQGQAALSVLGFTVVPSETASTVAINSRKDGDLAFVSGQFGGAFTISDGFPLYLEGFLGYTRYEPEFVVRESGEQAVLPVRWTGGSATGGVGWDIRLADELVLRPIANIALGHVESDASLLGRIIDSEFGTDIGLFRDQRLTAYGYGGSLMLDWERAREAYEADVELRYTHIRLEPFDVSTDIVDTPADAVTLGLWSRLRAPTGLTLLGRPIRAVGEASLGVYVGDQDVVLDSPWLAQIGAGAELDFAETRWVPISRGRLVGRFLFGEAVTGFSIGLGASF